VSGCTPRIGLWAAILSVLFAASFSIVALAANFTTLIPAIWVNPLSFAPSLLFYGLMSASAFVAAFAFPGQAQSFLRGALWAHGAMGPIVIAAIFWPKMTYVGALWIVTFPAMAFALAGAFRRAGAAGSGDARQRPRPEPPHVPPVLRRSLRSVPAQAK
jgi:hypothetical protein